MICIPVPTLTAAAGDDDNPESTWGNGRIHTDAWNAVPGTVNSFAPAIVAAPDDPYVYESRYACTDGDCSVFAECAVNIPACVASVGSPVAAAEIGSQLGPHTLRGKDTNVWTTATTQTFNITMLDQQVTITATPVAYTWNYGDGNVWGHTPVHGATLHQNRIGEQTQSSHVYIETGRLAINLTTHFNGSYTVNGGPQLPITGQGNIASAPLPITVWRAETNLYADNCFQNPEGIGC